MRKCCSSGSDGSGAKGLQDMDKCQEVATIFVVLHMEPTTNLSQFKFGVHNELSMKTK